jgi:hypothetical protein
VAFLHARISSRGIDVEPSFNSGLRIVAAATFAAVVGITAWHAINRPAEHANLANAPAADQAPSETAAPANADTMTAPTTITEAPPAEAAPAEPTVAAPPAEIAPPTEVTPHADATPPADAAPSAEAAASAVEPSPAPIAGPKYANVVPDKSPRMKGEPRERTAPKARKPSSDQTVIHVRRLQTQLMVGALSCGRPSMQTSYNAFVSKFDHALKLNGRQLKAYFASRYGARGTSEMDSYLTKLSNELSLVSMRNREFCERTGGLFDTVLALKASEIETFADRYMLQAVASRGF